MLHILFIILKILGILLLVILGLLLVCLLAVLFVPLRYRGDGNYQNVKEFDLHLHLSWLLHVVSLQIDYENGARYVLRLFGVRILKSGDDFYAGTAEEAGNMEMVQAQEMLETLSSHGKTENSESEPSESTGEMPESSDGTDQLIRRAEETSEKTDAAIEKAEETARLLEEAVKRRSAQSGQKLYQDDETEPMAETEEKEPKLSFFQAILSWLKRKFHTLRQRFLSLLQQIRQMEQKRQWLVAFLENEENQKSFQLLKRQFIRIVRHVFPRRISGQLTFGVEDPYWMGQILTAAAFLYPLYGRQIELTPIMDADVLNGELSFRGRIQLGVLLFMLLRIWMDKNIRTQVHKYRNRGGR